MANVLVNRLRQGHRTQPYPNPSIRLPERFRGRPELDASHCPAGCRACAEACPTAALSLDPLRIDLSACVFCGECERGCEVGGITFTRDHRLAARSRGALMVHADREREIAAALDAKTRKLFGRSLKLRQVSAGGCNACEADLNVLGTVVYDLGRYGIQFVASPRHADGMVITGPVTANMVLALGETYAAIPTPRIVIAVGACAASGSPFTGFAACAGIPEDLHVDLYIPGCPPHPWTILDGILGLLGRLG